MSYIIVSLQIMRLSTPKPSKDGSFYTWALHFQFLMLPFPKQYFQALPVLSLVRGWHHDMQFPARHGILLWLPAANHKVALEVFLPGPDTLIPLKELLFWFIYLKGRRLHPSTAKALRFTEFIGLQFTISLPFKL